MVIKDVILDNEKSLVADFLIRSGIKYEDNVDRTLYVEDDGKIVATVSASKYIIKCLAVDESMRSENLAGMLVSRMINILHENGIYYYQVFTKPEYKKVFSGLGFSLILETDKVAIFEGGDGDIQSSLKKMQVQIKFTLGLSDFNENSDVACVVINGNPFTDGHLKLIEYVSKLHNFVLVLVLEEEGSYFTFKERYAMAYLALKPYSNVMVLASTKYVVSKSTFPSYFLKSADEYTSEYAKYDALIFKNYFMPALGIKKRYVGTETVDYMCVYNDILKEVLGDKLEIVERFSEDNEIISARRVRQLIADGKTEEALKYIPKNNHALLKGMLSTKNEPS